MPNTRLAGTTMREDVDVPAGLAQRAEIGARRLAPGMMTRSADCGMGVPGSTIATVTLGSACKRVEVVEIGDARQPRHGDRVAAGSSRGPPLQRQRVLGGQAGCAGEQRDGAEARDFGQLTR